MREKKKEKEREKKQNISGPGLHFPFFYHTTICLLVFFPLQSGELKQFVKFANLTFFLKWVIAFTLYHILIFKVIFTKPYEIQTFIIRYLR